jgi:HlyD family secretion protein
MKLRITRKRVIRTIIALAVIALIVRAMWPEPIIVDTAVATTGPLEVRVEEDGRVRMVDRYLVTAPVAGRLERIMLREGEAVAARDVLLRVQPMPVDESTRAQMEARVNTAAATQRTATAAVDQADAAHAQAARELERRRALAAQGAIAVEQIEQYELALRARAEELNAARENLAAAQAELAAARTALLAATTGADRTAVVVRAPAAGRVLRIPERSSRIVMAGETLLEVGGAETLEVIVDVLSTDAVRIRSGMKAYLTGWGGPTLTARVRTVEPAAFTRLSALGVEEQRVNVILDPETCPPELGDGYRTDVAIVVWSGDDVLAVPSSALFRSGETWRIFLVVDGRAVLRDVEVGERADARTQIIAGLEAGDVVVLFPSDDLVDGARVRAEPEPADAQR